jgi:hypothetical protein
MKLRYHSWQPLLALAHSYSALDLEWLAFLDDFKQTLDKFLVPEAERAELFAIVDSTKKDIVLLKRGECN